jgi:hypothetical protein
MQLRKPGRNGPEIAATGEPEALTSQIDRCGQP